MHFTLKQEIIIWNALKQWDAVENPQFFYHYDMRKDCLETRLFFDCDGQSWRTDYEVLLEQYSTPYIYNWGASDLARMIVNIKEITLASLEGYQHA